MAAQAPKFVPRCPACGAARITPEAVNCYACGTMMPPCEGPPLERALRPFWIVMGGLYMTLFVVLLPIAVVYRGFIGVLFFQAIFMMQAVMTAELRWGKRFAWRDWFLIVLSKVGKVMVGMIVLMVLLFSCFSICTISMG